MSEGGCVLNAKYGFALGCRRFYLQIRMMVRIDTPILYIYNQFGYSE